MLSGACFGDSSVSFDPVPEAKGGKTSNGGGQPTSGSSTGASASGGSSTGGGQSQAGSANSAGTGAAGNGSGGVSAGAGGATGTAGSSSAAGTAGTAGASSAGMSGGGGSGGPGECKAATHGGHNYYFCGVVASAPAALALCQSLGMGMITVDSADENAFIVSKQLGGSWLGGTDELQEGQWRWGTNGKLFWDGGPKDGLDDGAIDGVYDDFLSGQPNDSNDDGLPENCLGISADGWNDLACTISTLRAACESISPIVLPNL
jgi:hypothetical protein